MLYTESCIILNLQKGETEVWSNLISSFVSSPEKQSPCILLE